MGCAKRCSQRSTETQPVVASRPSWPLSARGDRVHLSTGARAKAWCLLLHAEASLSLSPVHISGRQLSRRRVLISVYGHHPLPRPRSSAPGPGISRGTRPSSRCVTHSSPSPPRSGPPFLNRSRKRLACGQPSSLVFVHRRMLMWPWKCDVGCES